MMHHFTWTISERDRCAHYTRAVCTVHTCSVQCAHYTRAVCSVHTRNSTTSHCPHRVVWCALVLWRSSKQWNILCIIHTWDRPELRSIILTIESVYWVSVRLISRHWVLCRGLRLLHYTINSFISCYLLFNNSMNQSLLLLIICMKWIVITLYWPLFCYIPYNIKYMYIV